MHISQFNIQTGNTHKWSKKCTTGLILVSVEYAGREYAGALPSYSPHTDCQGCTHGCRHETCDPPLFTHTCMHTQDSPAYTLQVCLRKILISCVPPVVSACSPISTLTCSSPSDSHIRIHTYTSCSVCCSGCCCYGNHSIVQGGPCFPRIEKTPYQTMWLVSCRVSTCM